MGEGTKKIEQSDEVEVCEYCGGEGVVSVMAQVTPGEPHMADVGEIRCPWCQSKHEDGN